MSGQAAKFRVGQVIHHKRFDYRGVIVDVDATFQGTEAWYEAMARSRPPKDEPWYHVLVHRAQHMTYVAERNLEPDESGEPIDHPVLDQFFDELRGGVYVRDRTLH
ncbi:MAG: heat shock protein HspQ [Kiloniellales bacterium]|nr:heat shock protein HspQ [Kiloniellales bacterium]